MNSTSQTSRAPILFISTNDGGSWGGSEELWFETAMQMAKDGWPVVATVLKWPNRSPKLAVLEAANIRVIELGVPAAPLRMWYRAFPRHRYNWLRKIEPQFAVISQGTNFAKLSVELGEILTAQKVPFAMVSQSAHPWFWPSDDWAARMRTVMTAAKVSYFVSQQNWQMTRLQIGDPIRNGRVIRNTFSVEYDRPLPYPPDDVIRLAFVGRLEPGCKGHDLLFEALSRSDWQDRPMEVTLYGSGDHSDVIRRFGEAFNVRNVRFGGFTKPRDIWSENHALILPSRAEGLPLVVVEAMMCGRICIVTDVGGNSEVIDDGVTGFIAKDVSAVGVGDALERAWQRRSEWRSMGEQAAIAIRRKVPPDPAACLGRELAAIINGTV